MPSTPETGSRPDPHSAEPPAMADATDLADVQVVSLAVNLPGPVAAARLAAMGANLTKVEPPTGDPLQPASPGWYDELVAGQHVLSLDLKSEDGKSRLAGLLAGADLLLTATRPAGLERLGLDWSTLHARWPSLCQVAVVGRAGAGDDAGHDLTYQAEAGTVQPPALPRALIADLAGAERIVAQALGALWHRERKGVATYREVALADVAWAMAAAARHGLTGADGPLGGGLPAYGLYRTTDGYVAIAALEPHFLRRLCDGLGVDGSRQQLIAALAQRSSRQWQDWGRAHDVPVTAVVEP